jgi:Protein of unknown function (DUF2914)
MCLLVIVSQRSTQIRTHWGGRFPFSYLNKNSYCLFLFFIIPIYGASATVGSRNSVFVILLTVAAFLSTLDMASNEHLSASPALSSFGLFACVNLMLPVFWGVNNSVAFYVGAVTAFLGFATFCFRRSGWRLGKARALITVGGLLLMAFIVAGRPYIPPAPLRLMQTEFGGSFDPERHRITTPVSFSEDRSTDVFALTAISAPRGLRERVCHQWYYGNQLIETSPYYDVTGDPKNFQVWSNCMLRRLPSSGRGRLDVVTEGGQLIGRAWLPASR